MGWPARKLERSANLLVARAKVILRKRSSFMLVFDVKNSRNYDARELFEKVDKFCSRVARKYRASIVRGEINTHSYIKSFRRIIGDGGGGYFNNAEVVREIMKMAQKELAPIEFWWNVAQDIWDKKNSRVMA